MGWCRIISPDVGARSELDASFCRKVLLAIWFHQDLSPFIGGGRWVDENFRDLDHRCHSLDVPCVEADESANFDLALSGQRPCLLWAGLDPPP